MQSRFRDWGDARVFLAVMREGSTLAAARVIGINQTTVARRVDALEHVLGLKLFEKTTRGACPTKDAMRLKPLAEALEAAANQFETEAMRVQNLAKPPIRITLFDRAMFGNFGKIVAEFVDQNPGITFEFIAAERILDLIKGEADVALRLSASIDDDRLIARKIGSTQWTYYASHNYVEKHGTPERFSDDMGPHRVVLLSHVRSNRPNVLRCVSANELQLAIQSGQGIGPMPIFEGDRNPELVRCFDPPPEGADISVWLVTSPEARKREEVRRFTAFAAKRISKFLKGVTN